MDKPLRQLDGLLGVRKEADEYIVIKRRSRRKIRRRGRSKRRSRRRRSIVIIMTIIRIRNIRIR